MLVEAIEVIRELHTGELVTCRGDPFDVDSARSRDCPDGGVPLAVAVVGDKGVARFAPLGDHLIAVESQDDLIEQFRWFAGGWKVNADLPTPARFAGATQLVRPEDVAENIPCDLDLDTIAEAVSAFGEAGFTDIALVQVGGEGQEAFLREASGPR